MRNFPFDILRVVCALWIVGYWHLLDYLPYDAHPEIGDAITTTALAVFIFLSGFFLSKYSFANLQDCFLFYKKRFWRFYVLYLISIVTLILGSYLVEDSWFDSSESIILTLIGFSTIVGPPPPTLWFMSMLMFFYLITPFIHRVNLYTNIITSFAIFVLLLFLSRQKSLDDRMLIYFPVYLCGLNIKLKLSRGKFRWFVVGLIAWVILSYNPIDNIVLDIFLCFSGILSLIHLSLLVSEYISKNAFIVKLINVLSYLSLALYLFHRQIFEIARQICNWFSIPITYFVLLLMLLGAIIGSFIIQRCYDAVLKTTN